MRSNWRRELGIATALEAAWCLKWQITESYLRSEGFERGKRKFLERYNHDLMRMRLHGQRPEPTLFDRGSTPRKELRLRALIKQREALWSKGLSDRTPRVIKLSQLIEKLFQQIHRVDLFDKLVNAEGRM